MKDLQLSKKDLKIAFFGVKSWEREIIEKEIINLDSYGIGIFEGELHENIELAKKYDVVSVFIYSKMDKKVLDQLPNLKMVATRSTGYDHIDCSECEKRGVKVMNVPVYGSNTVAEFAFALLLVVAKKIVPSHQSVEDGEFNPEGLTGVDLEGKTLAVIGVGKIGQNMVRYARGFGMKVLGVERNQDPVLAKKLGFKYASLEEALKAADFVSVHVPYFPPSKDGPGTLHMINRSNIKLLKPGSYLINTSRGPVVETEAIVWALNKGILAGAGLDVCEEEMNVENISVVMNNDTNKDDMKELLSFHLLRDRDDVVFTPHNAFNTKEAVERIIKTTISNIKEFCK